MEGVVPYLHRGLFDSEAEVNRLWAFCVTRSLSGGSGIEGG